MLYLRFYYNTDKWITVFDNKITCQVRTNVLRVVVCLMCVVVYFFFVLM